MKRGPRSEDDDIGELALRLWSRQGSIGDLVELLRERVYTAYDRGVADGLGSSIVGEHVPGELHEFKVVYVESDFCGLCGMFPWNGHHLSAKEESA